MACETTSPVEKLYPIREVAQLTGVNPVTLRAWQRRYGLLLPRRTAKGHRLYSDADIATVKAILGWLDKGVAIRHIKALLDGGPSQAATTAPALPEVQQLLSALAALDHERAEQVLSGCLREYPLGSFRQRLFEPIESALRQGERPYRGLQYTLWRSLLGNCVSPRLNRQGKAKLGHCWLIRCGYRGHTLTWMTALEYLQQGYRVQLLDGIQQQLSPFVDLIRGRPAQVVVVGQQKLSPAIVHELQRLPQPPQLVGSIAQIHREDFQP